MSVRHVTFSQFERAMIDLEPKLHASVVKGLRSAALRLETMVVEEIETATPHPAVDTAALKRSVSTERVPDGAIVNVTAPHAAMIENGTRPFFPPLAPLIEWVKRKGLHTTHLSTRTSRKTGETVVSVRKKKTDADAKAIAYAVAKAISKRGIEPRHFFKKAWDRFPEVLGAEIRDALSDASKR